MSVGRGVLVSIGAVALAFALRLALQHWMGPASPFLLFTPAVMVAAFYAGVAGGALATTLSTVAGSRFFLPMLAGEPVIERWDRAALFLLTGILITVLAAVVEGARRQLAGSVWREQRARAAAEAANQAKDDFLALVGHELQTPASVILGWISMIVSQQLADDALFRALKIIERNATIQSRLVADVLDSSRVASGTMRLDCERGDLGSIVRGAAEQMRPTLAARQLRLDIDMSDDAWAIDCDVIRLQQVFTNLLSNAAKFTPPGGRVSITMSRRGDQGIVQVSDTGIGISPEFAAKVFDQFEQERDALPYSRGGLGLGLSICRHLVEQHGGSIAVRSEGRGLGTTVIVRLPLSRTVDLSDANDRSRVAPNALRAARVLMVEDDDDTRLLLKEILERYGATVHACRSAADAESSLETSDCDVLLCDLQLPHTDGLEFVRRLRRNANPRIASIPAASITASTVLQRSDEALGAGYQVHLRKPVVAEDLVAALMMLMRPAANARAH